ncbi:MAG: hypothetical protein OIF57_16310 [Marinobacterium sp.]|nr:hypothetical protein [Marinobacterium sp.]
MDKDTFTELLCNTDLEGLVFNNIHKGSVSIISNNQGRIHYHRGKDTISFKYSHLYKAWDAFRGESITCEVLKAWKPSLFDSRAHPKAGYDSNCGVFLFLLEHLGLAREVNRKGRKYSAELLAEQN